MSFDVAIPSSSPRRRPSHIGGVGLLYDVYDATMVGGTALTAGIASYEYSGTPQFEDYVTVRSDVILEYERAITELRLQVLHYKRIVAQLIGSETRDDYTGVQPVIPLNPSSVKLINTIVHARIPTTAIFHEFEEGEL